MAGHIICLGNFPAEVLVYIFSFFDVESIEAAEKVCRQWKKLISTTSSVWKSLIFQLCALKPQFKEILLTKVYTEIMKDPAKLKSLYYHMAKIEENVMNNSYNVRTLNCVDSEDSELDDNPSFRGVVDMIHSENRLVVSVYNKIQVWDMGTYKRTKVLDSSILDADADGGKTSCYTLQGDVLFCGTGNGFIKNFDMKTGKVQSNARKNSNYISDVVVNGDTLVSLDWYGQVTEWKIEEPGSLVQISNTENFVDPMNLYRSNEPAQRNPDRLLACAGDHVVTAHLCHLTYFRKGKFVRGFTTEGEGDVLCISIQGDLLAFGCKSENLISPTAGIYNLAQEGAPAILYLKNEPCASSSAPEAVISLNLSLNYLILGDLYGELHLMDISQIKFPSPGEIPVLELEKENELGVRSLGTIRTHEYGAFVWAVKADSYRIFSGDETGKIIVHDYMKYQVQN